MLDTIFTFYDRYILVFAPKIQLLVAFAFLLLLILSFLAILKKGHWIFIIIFAILFPGGWAALKVIGGFIFLITKFLLTRILI